MFLRPGLQLTSREWLNQVSHQLQRHSSQEETIEFKTNDTGYPLSPQKQHFPNSVTLFLNARNTHSLLATKTITHLGALNLASPVRKDNGHEEESLTAMTLSAVLHVPKYSLREINKQVINSSEMIDLKYIDLAGGFMNHPHMAALDEQGKPGYIHDAEALQKNPPQFTFDKQKARCSHNDATMQILSQRVFVDMTAHTRAEKMAQDGIQSRARIFCHIYTIEQNNERVQAIRETWGQKCDGFMAASTVTNRTLNTVNISHQGPEEYKNM